MRCLGWSVLISHAKAILDAINLAMEPVSVVGAQPEVDSEGLRWACFQKGVYYRSHADRRHQMQLTLLKSSVKAVNRSSMVL
jgi:hypothetical protein